VRALSGLPILFALLVLACSGEEGDEGRLEVVATTTQIGDFARNVGGDRIALTVLLSPNEDAHDFAPTPSQLRRIAEAGLVLRNGLGLDTFVEKALEGSGARVVIVSDGLSLREEDGAHADGNEEAAEAAGRDPHVWFSVANAKRMVSNVRDALVRADAVNAAAYEAAAAAYVSELDALDARIRDEVATVPSACRKLVTNHDVLGYYAEAYGFTVVGSVIAGSSSEARPSTGDVAEIVRRIRAENVPAVFAETSVNPALIRQVGREAGVKVVDDLYADSLGPKDSDGATYIAMMETNTRKIVEALRDCK
jgi:ABC-type Zn uptake system ZnuABC Zn-binding protein ZnuA